MEGFFTFRCPPTRHARPRFSAPTPVRPTAPAPPANNGGSSSGMPSKAELYERAKELGIEGRSKMSKQQLERAISEAS